MNAVGGYQMYSESFIVGKASTTSIDISPILPIIFRGLKSAKFGVVFDIN